MGAQKSVFSEAFQMIFQVHQGLRSSSLSNPLQSALLRKEDVTVALSSSSVMCCLLSDQSAAMNCTNAMISLDTDQGGKIHSFLVFNLPMLHSHQWFYKTWHTPTVTNCFEIAGKKWGWVIRRIKAERFVWQVRKLFLVCPLTLYKYVENWNRNSHFYYQQLAECQVHCSCSMNA